MLLFNVRSHSAAALGRIHALFVIWFMWVVNAKVENSFCNEIIKVFHLTLLVVLLLGLIAYGITNLFWRNPAGLFKSQLKMAPLSFKFIKSLNQGEVSTFTVIL